MNTEQELNDFDYLMRLYARFDEQLEKLRTAALDFSEVADERYAAILAEADRLRGEIVQMESYEPVNPDPAGM